jgi:transcriptional regulator with XRE-family HTH domain
MFSTRYIINILSDICKPVNLLDRIVIIYKEIMMNGDKIRQILAKNIKSFREHRSLSQAELAANSEISIPFLSEIERGNKWPFPDTLGKIAKALSVQIHELFREETSSKDERDYTAMVVNEILNSQKVSTDRIIKRYLK